MMSSQASGRQQPSPRAVLAVVLAGVLWLAPHASGVPPLGAQPVTEETAILRVAREIIGETMSPYCPGLLLSNCPSPNADTLRKAIVARVRAGESRERIVADLVAHYGEEVRAEPPRSGFGLVAWLTPAVVILGGGGWLAGWLLRRAGDHDRQTALVDATIPGADASSIPAAHDVMETAALRRLEALVRKDDG